MADDYVNLLLEYIKDYIVSQANRLIDLDYELDTDLDFTLNDSNELHIRRDEVKESTVKAIDLKITKILEEVKKYLIENKVTSPESFRANEKKILDFCGRIIKGEFGEGHST